MAEALRGLTTFIADIRNCNTLEDEQKRIDTELHKIRAKFKTGKATDSYSMKKYVAKILYVSMLGYPIDFGQMEAVQLITGSKFSEKQLGYLAITLLVDERSELVRIVINSILQDLQNAPRHDIFQCLALTSVANVGGKEMAETLAPMVTHLVFGTEKSISVMARKKACLALLRLYRTWPEILPAAEYEAQVYRLLEHPNLGVVTAALSLVIAVVSREPASYPGCVRQAVWLLDRIVLKADVADEYHYYEIPCPWTQVKLLRLLQYFPPPDDRNMHSRLVAIITAILQNYSRATQVLPAQVNAKNAVLAEATDLIIHLDSEPELVILATNLLGSFVESKVTNVRYLGLAKLAKLAATNHDSIDLIKRHQVVIVESLRDADISIRRRALELIYSMCDKSNAQSLVRELMQYLKEADYEIRDELVLKIAILAERFAVDFSWYFDTILELVALGGDNVSDDIWHRAIQIVTNHDEVQAHAARRCFDELLVPSIHEVAVRIAAYVLGEFGLSLSRDADATPEAMLNLLHMRFATSGHKTRALLLSTFSKFTAIFPALTPAIERILHTQERSMDVETQQRACEYLALASAQARLLPSLWEVMPAFPERESAVLVHLRQMEEAGQTDKGPGPAPKEEDLDAVLESVNELSLTPAKPLPKAGAAAAAVVGAASAPAAAPAAAPARPATAAPAAAASASAAPAPAAKKSLISLMDDGADPAVAAVAAGGSVLDLLSSGPSRPKPTNEALLPAFYAAQVGVIHEDGGVQLGLRTEFKLNFGRAILYVTSRSAQALVPCSIEALPHDAVAVKVSPMAPTLGAGEQLQIPLAIECRGPYTALPCLRVTFGAHKAVLALPIFPSKFFNPTALDSEGFLGQWNALGAGSELIVILKPVGEAATVEAVAAKMAALQLAVLANVDPNPSSVVFAGIWGNSTHLLLGRVEVAAAHGLYRLTMRCAVPGGAAEDIKAVVAKALGEAQK